MNELLQLALAAHGGTRRWSDYFKLEASLSIGTGPRPQAVRLVADLYKQRVVWSPSADASLATDTAWGPQHAAGFSGDAAWSDLIQPFLYTYPGFACEEIAPWIENGEQWRRLKVAFPEDLARHGSEQVSYFGPEGLLRRHDHRPAAHGGTACASYAAGYRDVDGIRVPTRRRVYAIDAHGRPLPQAPLQSVDVHHIAFV
jgi:hypothetical protein